MPRRVLTSSQERPCAVVPGDLFAKVLETRPEDASRVVVRFTSIPETAYFRAWYSKDGPQNFSHRELDEAKRKDLVRQAEAIFEQDQPLLPVSWEKINDGWFNYVKGHNPYNYFGIYDVVRFDAFWLDK